MYDIMYLLVVHKPCLEPGSPRAAFCIPQWFFQVPKLHKLVHLASAQWRNKPAKKLGPSASVQHYNVLYLWICICIRIYMIYNISIIIKIHLIFHILYSDIPLITVNRYVCWLNHRFLQPTFTPVYPMDIKLIKTIVRQVINQRN